MKGPETTASTASTGSDIVKHPVWYIKIKTRFFKI